MYRTAACAAIRRRSCTTVRCRILYPHSAPRHRGRRRPQGVRPDRRGRRCLLHSAARRDLRPDRAERRREDHHDGVRRGAARGGRRTDRGARARPGPQSAGAPAPDRGAAPGGATPEADQGVGGGRLLAVALSDGRGGWPAAPAARAPEQARRLFHEPVGRPETAAVHRPGAGQRPGGRVSRRADHGAGPTGATRDLGSRTWHPRSRQDGLPDDPPDGGSRASVRPGGDPRSRPDHRHRPPRRAGRAALPATDGGRRYRLPPTPPTVSAPSRAPRRSKATRAVTRSTAAATPSSPTSSTPSPGTACRYPSSAPCCRPWRTSS